MSFTRVETALAFRPSRLNSDLRRKRLRDRYVAVQFPDLAPLLGKIGGKPEGVIRLARELFDEGERRLGSEALTLAVQESPQDRSLPLALLELAYLAQEATLFSDVAKYFEDHFPTAPENATITRMGGHLSPRSGQFFGRHPKNSPWESAYCIPGWSLVGSASGDDIQHMNFRNGLLDSVAR